MCDEQSICCPTNDLSAIPWHYSYLVIGTTSFQSKCLHMMLTSDALSMHATHKLKPTDNGIECMLYVFFQTHDAGDWRLRHYVRHLALYNTGTWILTEPAITQANWLLKGYRNSALGIQRNGIVLQNTQGSESYKLDTATPANNMARLLLSDPSAESALSSVFFKRT